MNNLWEIYFSKTQFLGINNFVKLLAMWETWVWSLGWEDPLEEGVTAQFISVAQSCPTLCNPMDCSTPGLSVHHQLPEFTQTHVHWVGDTIQPSHPLSSPSPALNLSHHQGLFKWVSSSHQVAKVLECQLQHRDNPVQYSCLGNPHGERSVAGCSPWSCRVWHDWVAQHSTAQLSSAQECKKRTPHMVHVCTLSSFTRVWLFAMLWTVAH